MQTSIDTRYPVSILVSILKSESKAWVTRSCSDVSECREFGHEDNKVSIKGAVPGISVVKWNCPTVGENLLRLGS